MKTIYSKNRIKNYKAHLPNLIERSVYNKRRKKLFRVIETLREKIVQELIHGEDTFIIDSMPLPISKFSRAKRLKFCKENYDTAPSFGYCAAQKTTYFGYKLHAITTINGVITHFDLSKANMADIHYLEDIRDSYPGVRLLGDMAYLSDPLQMELFKTNRLLLETPKRRNQKNYSKYPAIFRKVRKRIETFYSQMHDKFKIINNYAT
ncbi:IS982 family transposase [Calditrichota bacterium LG25]